MIEYITTLVLLAAAATYFLTEGKTEARVSNDVHSLGGIVAGFAAILLFVLMLIPGVQ